MELKNYRFGHVESEEGPFENDLIVMDDWVHDNWWRKDGHRLVPEDLDSLMPKNPAKLIIGQGASSRMKLTREVKTFLEENGVDYEATSTDRAIERYNQLAEREDKEKVAGAFHLTC